VRGWLVRRLLQALLVYVIAIGAAFVLMRLAPGDPLGRLSDDRPIRPEQLVALRAAYGLDQPLLTQLGRFASGAIRGNFGTSLSQARPVGQLLLERLPASLLLGGAVLLLNFTVGLWLGVRQALASGRTTDVTLGILSVISIALPSFVVGLGLVWLLGLHGPHWPVAGMRDPLSDARGLWAIGDILRHMVLPAATLTLVTIGGTMRYQRAAMLEALAQPFVRTATAKGLTPGQVTWRHAWRAALLPVVTLLGLWLPLLVTGSLFVEAIFAWPGLGDLAARAASSRDYPLVMGATLLSAALVVIGGLLADVGACWLDPRVRPA
jgi:peptide/nickel transport system permease protein